MFSAKCRSWYKLGKEEGRVVGLWPGQSTRPFCCDAVLSQSFRLCLGSSLHAMRALQHPRWEDYDYESADPDENSMYWLGDGQTYNEKSLTGDSTSFNWFLSDAGALTEHVTGAWYLREDFIDRPPGARVPASVHPPFMLSSPCVRQSLEIER